MYSNELICKILEFIDNNVFSKILIDDLVNRFHYNRYYIMKLFKKEFGLSINSYINKLRVYYSLQEINNTDNLFIKVAINNGFYSLEYFSEIFKKEIGVSPSEYKKMLNYRLLDKKIVSNIIALKNLIKRKNIYLSNKKKVDSTVLKLSIFK